MRKKCVLVCVCVWMLDGVCLEHVHLNDKFNVRSMSYGFFCSWNNGL